MCDQPSKSNCKKQFLCTQYQTASQLPDAQTRDHLNELYRDWLQYKWSIALEVEALLACTGKRSYRNVLRKLHQATQAEHTTMPLGVKSSGEREVDDSVIFCKRTRKSARCATPSKNKGNRARWDLGECS